MVCVLVSKYNLDRAQIQEMCPKLPDSLSPFALLEREAGHETGAIRF